MGKENLGADPRVRLEYFTLFFKICKVVYLIEIVIEVWEL